MKITKVHPPQQVHQAVWSAHVEFKDSDGTELIQVFRFRQEQEPSYGEIHSKAESFIESMSVPMPSLTQIVQYVAPTPQKTSAFRRFTSWVKSLFRRK